jgi:hypothetical protein
VLHVVGPEQGLILPGMLVVCGDSHTATHGALGALAFGIGATEVAQVLATQALWQPLPKRMPPRKTSMEKSSMFGFSFFILSKAQDICGPPHTILASGYFP